MKKLYTWWNSNPIQNSIIVLIVLVLLYYIGLKVWGFIIKKKNQAELDVQMNSFQQRHPELKSWNPTADATAIYAAGYDKWGTDNTSIENILYRSSFSNVIEARLILRKAYKALFNRDIVADLIEEYESGTETAEQITVMRNYWAVVPNL